MCMSCGCMQPNENHGDSRNITRDAIDQAAQAAHVSRDEAAQNIVDCCQQTGTGEGASGETAAPPSAPA